MMTSTKATFNIDMEKYRLRRFVDRLIDMGEVEIHDEPVPLTGARRDHREDREGGAVQEAPARKKRKWSRRPRPAESA